MEERVTEKLKTIIVTIMELDESIDNDADLTNDIGMASIDFVELTVAIEREFGVSIPNELFSRPLTISSLSQVIATPTAQEAAQEPV